MVVPKHRLRCWLLPLGVVAGLCLSASVAGSAGAEQQELTGLTSAQEAAAREFLDRPLEVSPEWREVEPYSAELIRNGSAVRDAWKWEREAIKADMGTGVGFRSRDQLECGWHFRDSQWADLAALVAKHKSYLDTFLRFVSTPGYEITAFTFPEDFNPPDAFRRNISVEALTLQAYWQAHVGQSRDAFESLMGGYRVGVRHPAVTRGECTFTTTCEELTSPYVARLVKMSSDVASLQYALTEMNRLDPLIHNQDLDHIYLTDLVGAVRRYQRWGYPVDLASLRTGRQWFRVRYNLNAYSGGTLASQHTATENRVLVSGHPSLPVRQAYADKQLQSIAEAEAQPSRPGKVLPYALERLALSAELRGQYDVAEEAEYLAEQQWEPVIYAHWPAIGMQVAKARFDLARLALAVRLAELRNKRPFDGDGRALLRYFPHEPLDPFSHQPYRWDPTQRLFYSVGPDKHDDQNKLLYDSEANGTMSRGDIYLY